MNIGWDVLKKAQHAAKQPGIGSGTSFFSMVKQGLPYLTSLEGNARPPITIYWNINSVCNLHCKMCDVGTFNEDSNFFKNLRIDRKLHEIALDKFCSVVDEVSQFRPVMAINGTEPLMYRPLEEAIAYAKAKGMDVAVTTGAYTLPYRAESLADAGLARLNVSIDGAADLHNEIRGRDDVFERAIEGVQRFREATTKRGYTAEILINCTIMNLNYQYLTEFYEAISDLPIDRINFVNMNFVTDGMAQAHNLKWGEKFPATVNCLNDDVQPDQIDMEALAEQIDSIRAVDDPRVSFLPLFEKKQLATYYHSPMKFMGRVPCMSTWFIAQIMADGEVIPYTRCYHVPLGNINDYPFLTIWNGDKAKQWRRDLRKQGRFPACSRCDMVC